MSHHPTAPMSPDPIPVGRDLSGRDVLAPSTGNLLIVGRTFSGKTHLVETLEEEYLSRGVDVTLVSGLPAAYRHRAARPARPGARRAAMRSLADCAGLQPAPQGEVFILEDLPMVDQGTFEMVCALLARARRSRLHVVLAVQTGLAPRDLWALWALCRAHMLLAPGRCSEETQRPWGVKPFERALISGEPGTFLLSPDPDGQRPYIPGRVAYGARVGAVQS